LGLSFAILAISPDSGLFELNCANLSLSGENPSIKVISTLSAIALSSSDPDLLEASISELSSQSVQRKAYEDPNGLSDLVLYANALTQGDDSGAIAILRSANDAKLSRDGPSAGSSVEKNRLGKALIASGQVDDALELLRPRGTDSAAGITAVNLGIRGGVKKESRDSRLEAEEKRLRGIAGVIAGPPAPLASAPERGTDETVDEAPSQAGADAHGQVSGGLADVHKSVMLRPWETAGWEALAWTRLVEGEN
jgi:hypothetical protein